MVFVMAFLFMLLGSTASDFFVTSLQDISTTLHLSDNVAGVTFLALGNGAPDLFSMLAGAQNNQFQMSLGEAMGSGFFIITIVLASVGIVQTFTLEPLSLFMDALVYLGTVIYLLIITLNSEVVWSEMALFPVIYAGYVTAVIVIDYVRRRKQAKLRKAAKGADEEEIAASDAPYVPFSEAAAVSLNGPALPVLSPPRSSAHPVDAAAAPAKAEAKEEALAAAPASGGEAEEGGQGAGGDADGEAAAKPREPGLKGWAKAKWASFKDWAEWEEKGWFGKFRFMSELPLTLMRMLTIPSVERASYARLALNCLWSPVFTVWAVGWYNKMIGDVFPMWGLALIVGGALMPVLLLLNMPKVFPKVHLIFTFWNFIVSIVWLNMLANELVTLLQSLGFLFGISGAIIGATVLAAGNSVGDLVADIAVARQGQPRAAVAACYASPLLNALLGLGITLLYALIKSPDGYGFTANKSIWFVYAFVIAVLVLTLIVFPAFRMRMTRVFAVVLFAVYLVFLVVIVLVEAKVIAK